MVKPKTEQEARKALDKHLQGNELFKDVAWIVGAIVVFGCFTFYLVG